MNNHVENVLQYGLVVVSTPVWLVTKSFEGIKNIGNASINGSENQIEEKKSFVEESKKSEEEVTKMETKKTTTIVENRALFSCKKAKVDSTYNLDVINSSMPATELVKKIENALKYDKTHRSRSTGIRILLYGASGTGKTEFARYIAEHLGRNLDVEVASSVIMVWSGETENRISEVFRNADNDKTVLLFDEADSFFYNRKSAGRMWESRQVNEFLTQMESFNGIVICTTNQRSEMDAAMQRRFDFMVELKPVEEESIPILLKNYFPELTFSDEEISVLQEVNTITPGDFGLLQRRRRFMDENEISSAYIINELISMQNEKLKSVC